MPVFVILMLLVNFNYSDPLPAGFVVNRMDMPASVAIDEVSVAMDIIFGHHGSKIINEENPFLLVAIGNNEEELSVLKQELSSLNNKYGKLVKIDGLLAA